MTARRAASTRCAFTGRCRTSRSIRSAPVGGRAVVALLEHRWAVGLRDSLLAAGASLRYETWLDAADRDRLESLIEHVQR